jgi:hypothetical protein
MMGGMSAPGRRATDDPASLCTELVGLTEAVATERISECGFKLRVADVGGRPIPLHSDRKPDRVNLWLSDDRIVVCAEAF